MNLKLLLVFTLAFTLSSHSQNLTFVKDSIMDAYMKSGYANTHFMPKGKTDANDLRQGNWKDYEVLHDFTYLNLDDVPEQVFGDFLLYAEGKFIDGKREGLWKFYVLEDKTFKKILQKEMTYVSNEIKGIYNYFYPNGKVSHVGNYDTDKISEMTVYYNNGKIFRTNSVVSGMITGKATTFYRDGKIAAESNYENDSLHGEYRSYYPSGSKQQISYFVNGKLDGNYQYYHENGQLWIEKEYKNCLLWNVKYNYDESGKSRDVGTLKNGNGTIIYYKSSGEIYNIQTFENGIMVSEAATSEFE